jgi:hypothetical protein
MQDLVDALMRDARKRGDVADGQPVVVCSADRVLPRLL